MSIQHIIKQGYLSILMLPCFFVNQPVSAQNKQEVQQLLWQGIGGQDAWEEAQFLMFSCTSNLTDIFPGQHAYIWDRFNGNCRFEGVNGNAQKLIVLFNTQKKTGKVFLNNKLVSNADSSRKWVQQTLNAFYSDVFWLFPPNFFNATGFHIKDEALIGTNKYYVAEIKPIHPEYGEYVSEWYIDRNTGRIARWKVLNLDSTTAYNFTLSNFKDVGAGLLLATSFRDAEKGISINYSIVSALINVETDKFNKP